MSTTTMWGPTLGSEPAIGVTLRQLRPGDSAAVVAVFDGLGARSRTLRYLSGKPRLTAAELRRLVAVDGRDHVALLASATGEGRPIGIARLIRRREVPQEAEVALEVVDEWQRRGVGALLVSGVVSRAAAIGVRHLTAFVSPDNRAALRLLKRAAGAASLVQADPWLSEYTVSLDRVFR
jgi:RimJ/RimL family protein N-acetyltransferase